MERWIRKVAQPVDADDSIFTLRSGAPAAACRRGRVRERPVTEAKTSESRAGKIAIPNPLEVVRRSRFLRRVRVPSTKTDVKPIPNLFDGAVKNRTPCYTRGAGAGGRTGGEPRARAPINELARTSTYLRARLLTTRIRRDEES